MWIYPKSASARESVVDPACPALQSARCRVAGDDDRSSAGGRVTRIPTDPEQIRLLAAVMAENGLTEVELADKDTRIRIVRGTISAVQPATLPPVVATMPAGAMPGTESGVNHPGSVTSPMVGVAFLAPEPGAPNFVSVGQQVSVGQTLLLIEAMKTFNQIKATRAGTVTKIFVQNTTPVEYGELLMIVE
jgi:acetyl-CoA carboxylase biotin carboxyl carrier protein